jgi:D-alanyl-D-alanine carboxypeptidase
MAPSPPPPPPPPPPPTATCPVLPPSTQPADSLAGIVDAAVDAEMKAQELPGLTIAVAKRGVTQYAQAYGYADLGTCRKMLVTDSMQMGSVTKQFTATAIMQLKEAGLIDIDHTVVSYLPAFAFDSRITVRMLLNHTSGLPDYLDFPGLEQYALTGGPESIALDAIAQATLRFQPGSAFAYSNSNYFVLGSIIEALSSQTYADYLATQVYPLAGLTHTYYLQPSDAAHPYGSTSVVGPYAGVPLHPSVNFAAGQLWSNVEDLAVWDDAWLSGRVISESSMNLMRTPPDVLIFGSSNPSDYGMGWITHALISGHPFIWHNGLTTSYSAFNGVLTDTGLTVTVLTNYTINENAVLLPLAEKIVGKICDTPGAGGC